MKNAILSLLFKGFAVENNTRAILFLYALLFFSKIKYYNQFTKYKNIIFLEKLNNKINIIDKTKSYYKKSIII